MPDALATPGASNANSFASVTFADAYLEARSNASAWNDSTDDDAKARALIDATRELNYLPYIGDRVTATQSLSWPRRWAVDDDAPKIAGVQIPDPVLGFVTYFSETIIPDRLQRATCELALEFLKAGTSDVAAIDPNTNIQSKTTGPLSKTFVEPPFRVRGLGRFPRVVELISTLVSSASSRGGLNMVRV
jgi:hypothetical protein